MINLREKINDEYMIYECGLLITSKQNIYDKAEEICHKKKIRDELLQYEYSEEDEQILIFYDGLLDYIYLLAKENHLSTRDAFDLAKFKIVQSKQTDET